MPNLKSNIQMCNPIMSRSVFLGLCAFIVSTLGLIGCTESDSGITVFKTKKVLDEYKDSLKDHGMVALIDNGAFVDSASVGYSFGKNAISTTNRFCIGSCTKMFTATAVLKLQEKGLLNVNDAVSKYLAPHPFIDSTITIRQLLNHTSGLTDILKSDFQNEPFINPKGDFSDKVLFARIDTVDFQKGSKYAYCNTNYFLLAKIMEEVTDKSWEMNIQELIIEPLKLRNTFPYHSNTISNLAHPMIEGQDLHNVPKRANSKLSEGSGNIVSDLMDMNTFIRALLLDKTLLEQKTLDQMTSFFEYKNNKSGLGLFEEQYGDRMVWGHTGLQISYISYVFVDPKTKESIIVLTNSASDPYIDFVFEGLIND